VGVEIVRHQMHFARMRRPAAQHAAGESDGVDLGAPDGDLCNVPLTLRFDRDKDVAGSGAPVFVIGFGRGA
jgi:hypothetical protein